MPGDDIPAPSAQGDLAAELAELKSAVREMKEVVKITLSLGLAGAAAGHMALSEMREVIVAGGQDTTRIDTLIRVCRDSLNSVQKIPMEDRDGR